MSEPPQSEGLVAKLLSRELGVNFGASKRPLGTWGQADRCVELAPDRWLLLKVEDSRHPSTMIPIPNANEDSKLTSPRPDAGHEREPPSGGLIREVLRNDVPVDIVVVDYDHDDVNPKN